MAVGRIVGGCGEHASCVDVSEQQDDERFVPTYDGGDPVIGDRTFGGHSDRVVVEEGFTLRVPDSLDDAREHGAGDVPPSKDADAMAKHEEDSDVILNTIPVGHDVGFDMRPLERGGAVVLAGPPVGGVAETRGMLDLAPDAP